jgi:hypothetical protein
VAYAVQAVDAVGWTRTIRGTLTIAAPAVVPPAVVPPTVVPPVADPAVATVAAAPAATAVHHASLAATGSPTGPTLAVALGLAAAGAGLLVLARRGGRRARAEVVSRS